MARAGIQGTIHATLVRNHGYTGSYSSMYRFLGQLVSLQQPDVPLRLTFKPADAVQVDFGAGPLNHRCVHRRDLQDLVLRDDLVLVASPVCRVCPRPDRGDMAGLPSRMAIAH